jgi:hypothetical protein
MDSTSDELLAQYESIAEFLLHMHFKTGDEKYWKEIKKIGTINSNDSK